MPYDDRLQPIVTLTDAPTAEEEHVINSGLARFNEQQSGIRDSRPLAVIIPRSSNQAVSRRPYGPDFARSAVH